MYINFIFLSTVIINNTEINGCIAFYDQLLLYNSGYMLIYVIEHAKLFQNQRKCEEYCFQTVDNRESNIESFVVSDDI